MDKQETTVEPVWQNPWSLPTHIVRPEPYQPTNTFPTEADLRAFVKRCVDERLDELATEMRTHPGVQPGTWRRGVE